jgi:hypothetical protein
LINQHFELRQGKMMPTFEGWYEDSDITPLGAEGRSVLAWRRIEDRATSVTILRGSVTLDAQTVRIEFDDSQSSGQSVVGAGGSAEQHSLILFGVVGHPSVDDTDLERGDRFAQGTMVYEIKTVKALPGEIQARAVRLES